MNATQPVSSNAWKIIGGRNAFHNESLYKAAILINGDFFCGGSIISPRSILTAKHCMQIPDLIMILQLITIRAGSLYFRKDGVEKKVSSIIQHDKEDITLLILRYNLEYTNVIKPIKLATRVPTPGQRAIISGWGMTKEGGFNSEILQVASVLIIDIETCIAQINSIQSDQRVQKNKHICAGRYQGGVDACQGDSGGALVVFTENGAEMAGITSFGIGCGRPNLPGVYASVYYNKKWIMENMVA